MAKLGPHLDSLGNRGSLGAGQGPGQPALEQRLRPLAKSLPALLKLLEEAQARSALRNLAVGLLEPALDLAKFPGQLGDALLRPGDLLRGP